MKILTVVGMVFTFGFGVLMAVLDKHKEYYVITSQCEKELPRNVYCEIVISAKVIPQKN